MKIYIYHRTKNFCPPNTFSEECYGPFNSVKGATLAYEWQKRVNNNTGEYFNTVKIIRRKNEPEFRTLTWEDVCNSYYRFMDDKKDWHLI